MQWLWNWLANQKFKEANRLERYAEELVACAVKLRREANSLLR